MNRLLEQYAGMKVLIIDDDESDLEFLKKLLLLHGIDRVYIETDARRTLKNLTDQHPDLVLLDLHMPHVVGFSVLDEIRRFAAGAYLPVLMLTGDVAVETRNRALMRGAQDFLTKPIDATEALLRIANLLNTRHLYSRLKTSGPARQDLEPSLSERAAEMRPRILETLQHELVVPVFQPIVDLENLETVGHESLARFPDPTLGGPDTWFRDAFAVGLGVDLEWLAATSALKYFENAPPDVFLSVNMSPSTVLHLSDAELCPPSLCPRIVIELTEHVPIEDYGAIHRALDGIRSHGARLSADDLGSGYAGFRHLVRLQPDLIKLDISLIAGIHRNREQQALTRAIHAFSLEVGAEIIAEGVEQVEELRVLRDLGIEYGQGYLFGRPTIVPHAMRGTVLSTENA